MIKNLSFFAYKRDYKESTLVENIDAHLKGSNIKDTQIINVQRVDTEDGVRTIIWYRG